MKVIIPLTGNGNFMRPQTWSKAKPLLHVAGNTIVGHMLNLMSEITTEEVIFVVGDQGNEIEAWIRQNYPDLDLHFIVQEKLLGQVDAVKLCGDLLDDGEVLVAFDDAIVNTDYPNLAAMGGDSVILVQETEKPQPANVVVTDENGMVTDFSEQLNGGESNQVLAGVYWFKNGRALLTASQQSQTMLDVCRYMLANGAILKAEPAFFCLDTTTPDALLKANKRLLALGYGSDNAIDRSYAEDFTVLPPVFIHQDATVTNCVIGPYVSIEAGASIQDSIVRNSIVDGGTAVSNTILDSALIGENCQIIGKGRAIFVGDNSIVNL